MQRLQTAVAVGINPPLHLPPRAAQHPRDGRCVIAPQRGGHGTKPVAPEAIVLDLGPPPEFN